MSKERIEKIVEYLNNAINVERNSYFGKGCITMPLIEADKILDILKCYRKQSDVVREIFEELEAKMEFPYIGNACMIIERDYDEIKKKYTGEIND